MSRAFTLIEVLVVVSIIAILTLAVMTTLYSARPEARDKVRLAEAEQLKLGIRLYKEANGEYPPYPNGTEIGVGGSIDQELLPFLPNLNSDPLNDGAGSAYSYWYYPSFNCNGEVRAVIVIRTMEREKNRNFEEVCGGQALLNEHKTGDYFYDKLFPTAHAGGGGYSQGSYYSQSAYVSGCSVSLPTSGSTCRIDINASQTSLPIGGGSVTLCWESNPNRSAPPRYVHPIGWSNTTNSGWARTTMNVNVINTTTFTYTTNPETGYNQCTDSVTVNVASAPTTPTAPAPDYGGGYTPPTSETPQQGISPAEIGASSYVVFIY